MKQQIKNLSIISVALFLEAMLHSCQKATEINEIYFTDNSIVYDYPSQNMSDTLIGVPVLSDRYGIYNLNIVDSLICLSTKSKDGMFEINNLKGDSITTVGFFGQGPNDFTSNRTNKMICVENGNLGLWIVDVNSAKLKCLDLQESIKSGCSRVDTTFSIQPMVKNAFYVDGKIIEEIINDNNYDIVVSSSDDNTILHHEPLFKIDFGRDMFTAYNSTMSVSPNGEHLVCAMSAINEINILNLNDYTRLTISMGNVDRRDDIIDSEQCIPKWTYYSNLALNENYIFGLYENQTYVHSDEYDKGKCELHVFDYQGNLKKVVPLDRFLLSISYSARDNMIYAIDDNDNIYKYDVAMIEDFIKDIS